MINNRVPTFTGEGPSSPQPSPRTKLEVGQSADTGQTIPEQMGTVKR